MKWVEHHEVSGSIPSRDKTLGDFFPFVLVLVDRVAWYLLLGELTGTLWNQLRTSRL
uniref:Seven-transmembrane-domain protein 1 n=1 Tax=Solanum tuberosum TaxID=4113 RepID=M1CBD1_SOLTU